MRATQRSMASSPTRPRASRSICDSACMQPTQRCLCPRGTKWSATGPRAQYRERRRKRSRPSRRIRCAPATPSGLADTTLRGASPRRGRGRGPSSTPLEPLYTRTDSPSLIQSRNDGTQCILNGRFVKINGRTGGRLALGHLRMKVNPHWIRRLRPLHLYVCSRRLSYYPRFCSRSDHPIPHLTHRVTREMTGSCTSLGPSCSSTNVGTRMMFPPASWSLCTSVVATRLDAGEIRNAPRRVFAAFLSCCS